LEVKGTINTMNNNPPYPPPTTKKRSRKSVAITIILQSLPMLGATSCAANGFANETPGLWLFLWIGVIAWGLGYAYLGRIKRFALVFLIGPFFAYFSCGASLQGAHFPDYEHSGSGNSTYKYTDANMASFQEALIIAGAELILIVDAWRLAEENNAEVEDEEARKKAGWTV
jgi:hypothetical protein